mmetsp:Transcript_4675/g.6776  ORF Transcript_4675/g.6776 Transcript_4675/m.6776 type:complete len:351 (+) Transcript_4675:63-1115(+)|eukprot:CAMPEP_0194203008 /NCGR_PEP_ID=MMETSP0156-20130528/2903_1 /TAXON_ID=33649 /ORGANISM="Thalassionema nitzschioides, Strain L26-B" /LENGTH=350 /DNA_ID=CAMNT_0038928659 /DNA_START=54 /DNA_END=1106 /DNA_ORIENTATION=-
MSGGHRKSFGRGEMTRGANSGPAIMMMPPHIRATFMPNPPLSRIVPPVRTRKNQWTGMTAYLDQFEEKTDGRKKQKTPLQLKTELQQQKKEEHKAELEPAIAAYRQEQKECAGEFEGMNCYNTLFVGRLAYEVTERKLLREFEQFGPVKDLKIIKDDKQKDKSKGFSFVEFEHEEDMKRAYRAADGLRLEGRQIVVDVERGHTVPNWLPRRLGGGLGGTRLGGKDKNVFVPGRFDPSKAEMSRGVPPQQQQAPPPPGGGFGRGGGPGPPPTYGGGGGGFGRGRGGGGGFGPPRGGGGGGPGGDRWERHGPRFNDNRGPPPGDWNRGGGGGGKRPRSRSPERRDSRSRRRF